MCIQDILPDFIQNLCDVADALDGKKRDVFYNARVIKEFKDYVNKITCACIDSVDDSQEKIRTFSRFVETLE